MSCLCGSTAPASAVQCAALSSAQGVRASRGGRRVAPHATPLAESGGNGGCGRNGRLATKGSFARFADSRRVVPRVAVCEHTGTEMPTRAATSDVQARQWSTGDCGTTSCCPRSSGAHQRQAHLLQEVQPPWFKGQITCPADHQPAPTLFEDSLEGIYSL